MKTATSRKKKVKKTNKIPESVVREVMANDVDYPIHSGGELGPHGKSKIYSLYIRKLNVNDWFLVPERDYTKASAARSHYQKRFKGTRISTAVERDPNTLQPLLVKGERQYRFMRMK